MKTVTPTQLRSDLYNLLDEVLKTGQPLEIKKGNRKLRVIPVQPVNKLDQIISRPEVIPGDPEDLVMITWETEVDNDIDLP